MVGIFQTNLRNDRLERERDAEWEWQWQQDLDDDDGGGGGDYDLGANVRHHHQQQQQHGRSAMTSQSQHDRRLSRRKGKAHWLIRVGSRRYRRRLCDWCRRVRL